MKTLLIPTFFMLSLLISCTKDNDEPAVSGPPQTNQELFAKISGTWGNGVRYCAQRDVPTGVITNDTTYLTTEPTIVQNSDTTILFGNSLFYFSGDLAVKKYTFRGETTPGYHGMHYMTIDSNFSSMRVDVSQHALGSTRTCYYTYSKF